MAPSSPSNQAEPDESTATTASRTSSQSINKAVLPPPNRHPLQRPGPGRSRLGRPPSSAKLYQEDSPAASGCERALFDHETADKELRAGAQAGNNGDDNSRRARPRVLRSESSELRQYIAWKLLDRQRAQGRVESLPLELVDVHIPTQSSLAHLPAKDGFWNLPSKDAEGRQSVGLFLVNAVLLLASLSVLLAGGASITTNALTTIVAPAVSSVSTNPLIPSPMSFSHWQALTLPASLHRYLPFKPNLLEEQRSFLFADASWAGNSHSFSSFSTDEIRIGVGVIVEDTIVVQNDVVESREQPAMPIDDADPDRLGSGSESRTGLSRKLLWT